MKAAVLTHLNRPLELMDLEVPSLKAGEVLVRLKCSGVCHSQLMEATGKRGDDKFLPHLLGHEASGIVEAIGPQVTKVKPGQAVILGWIRGEGLEARGIQYKSGNLTINAGGVTTFNEMAVVAENRCTLMPAGLSWEVGALFGCAVLTGAGMVLNELNPKSESTAMVVGLGGIGLSALLALATYKCKNLIAVDINPEKLALAKELGATTTVLSTSKDWIAQVMALTQGVGVDYAVEAAGTANTIESAFTATRKFGGICIFASHPASGTRLSLDPYDFICGKQLKGSWGGGAKPDRDIPLIAKVYLEGKMPLEKLISPRNFGLSDINLALNELAQGGISRPMIRF